MEAEGILTLSETGIQLTEAGKPFLRNVCSCIDRYYGTELNQAVQAVFSKAL
jgi:coproporphyrinogen III oxidase-like Fe-S oxidoreductase